MQKDGWVWCELCRQWETESEWNRRHVRALSPAEEAALTRERRVVVISTPATRLTPNPRPAIRPNPRPELFALAEKVRQLRASLGLSQSALAEILGVRTLAVKRWEAGKVQPREKILKRLEKLEASLEGRGEE